MNSEKKEPAEEFFQAQEDGKKYEENIRKFAEAPRVYIVYLFEKKYLKKIPYLFLEKASVTQLITKYYNRANIAIQTNRSNMSEDGYYPIAVLQPTMMECSLDIYQDQGEVFFWSKKEEQYVKVANLRHTFTGADSRPWATVIFSDNRFSNIRKDVSDIITEIRGTPNGKK